MKSFGLDELLNWLEAEAGSDELNCPGPAGLYEGLVFNGISTDTRSLKRGQAFLALKGNNFDGHTFLTRALDNGAGVLIVESSSPEAEILLQTDDRVYLCRSNQREIKPGQVPVLKVEDTLVAYQRIARGYRITFRGSVIAITGSVGKTSTREMVCACLSESLRIHATRENLNNEIGLPATIIQASSEEDAVVLEMGMRGSGEIELLSLIAQPDIAMITNIGWSHIERLGSREAILRAKSEIIAGLNPDGWLILNADDPMLDAWRSSNQIVKNLFLVSADGSPDEKFPGPQLWAEQIQISDKGTDFLLRSQSGSWTVNLNVPGRHHVRNALFGFAAAALLGVPVESAVKGSQNYSNTGSRQKIIEIENIRIIDDSYNAAPESMLAAIEALALIAGDQRKIAVLGCMLELGEFSHELHLEIGMAAAKNGVSKLLLIGEFAEAVRDGAISFNPDLDVRIYKDHSALSRELKSALSAGDNILVKGSRAFKLEKVVQEIIRLQEEAAL
jgi:UDP-N-acetylmuramoyl-tripeptide--D-alanyl-D-alanine ligase